MAEATALNQNQPTALDRVSTHPEEAANAFAEIDRVELLRGVPACTSATQTGIEREFGDVRITGDMMANEAMAAKVAGPIVKFGVDLLKEGFKGLVSGIASTFGKGETPAAPAETQTASAEPEPVHQLSGPIVPASYTPTDAEQQASKPSRK